MSVLSLQAAFLLLDNCLEKAALLKNVIHFGQILTGTMTLL